MKPRLLDLYCCQGGASKGYADAGFEVVGVDVEPQPRYPYQFHRADAAGFVLAHLEWIRRTFAAVHASPPCQRYSNAQRIRGREHPDLIGPTREALDLLGLPYVIENVEDARGELKDPVLLCGAMARFSLQTYRHRLFESGGGFALRQPAHPAHLAANAKMGRPVRDGEFMHIVGNFSDVPRAKRIMGMPWASRDGLREAIPPAYAEWVGRELAAHLAVAGSERAA